MNEEKAQKADWPKRLTTAILVSYSAGFVFFMCWLASLAQVRAFYLMSVFFFSIGFLFSTFVPLLILIEVSAARKETNDKLAIITAALKLMNGRM